MASVPPPTVADRMEALLPAGLSAREFSLQITGKPDFLRDLKRKGHVPAAENLARAAELLGVSIDYLLGKTDNPAQLHSEVGIGEATGPFKGFPRSEPMIPLVGTGDCADLAVCTDSGQLVDVQRSSFDPDFHVRYIQRPPALTGARDLYAIYFHGSSMSPRFEPGEVGIVDPRRPVAPGDYALVQLFDDQGPDGDGESFVGSVLVKRMVRQSASEVVLEQFNPPMVFTVPRAQVARIHRIMPQTELLF